MGGGGGGTKGMMAVAPIVPKYQLESAGNAPVRFGRNGQQSSLTSLRCEGQLPTMVIVTTDRCIFIANLSAPYINHYISLLCSHLHMAFPERDRWRAAAARKERVWGNAIWR